MAQFIVKDIRDNQSQVVIDLAVYLAEGFDYAKAKEAADTAQAELEEAQASLDAKQQEQNDLRVQADTLGGEIAELSTIRQQKLTALAVANRALNPDFSKEIPISNAEILPILTDPGLSDSKKVEAMIDLKRAEIEATVKEQAGRQQLLKKAQEMVVGSPIEVKAEGLELTNLTARSKRKHKKGE